jgi:hypothetical protein
MRPTYTSQQMNAFTEFGSLNDSGLRERCFVCGQNGMTNNNLPTG